MIIEEALDDPFSYEVAIQLLSCALFFFYAVELQPVSSSVSSVLVSRCTTVIPTIPIDIQVICQHII